MQEKKTAQLSQIICQYFKEGNSGQSAVRDWKKINKIIFQLLSQTQIANYKCNQNNSIWPDILKVINSISSTLLKLPHSLSHSIFRYVLKKCRYTEIFKQTSAQGKISKNLALSEKYAAKPSSIAAETGDLVKPQNMINRDSLKHSYNSFNQLCCQPIFDQSVQIPKTSCKRNQFFYFNDVSIEGQSNFLALSKFICSVCNKGGGIIFFGFQSSGAMILPKGFPSNEIQSLMEIQNKIRLSANIIKPGCELQFHRLPIRVKQNATNVCLKIVVIPTCQRQMAYIQLSQSFTSNAKTSEIYEFGPQGQPILKKNNIYSLVYQLKKNKLRDWIYHQGCIKCNKPFTQLLKTISLPHQKAVSQNDQDQQKEKKQLDTKFNHKSLLIVDEEKENRYIEQFEDLVKNSKVQYFIKKPFSDVFNFKGRSVWMICHNVNFAFLKNMLKFHEQEKIIDAGKITMMPIYKKLQIEKSKLSSKNKAVIQSQLKKYFAAGYGQNQYEIMDKNKISKKMVQLSFETEWQSLFAYMLFEALKLRPYFTKNGNIFKVGQNIKVSL